VTTPTAQTECGPWTIEIHEADGSAVRWRLVHAVAQFEIHLIAKDAAGVVFLEQQLDSPLEAPPPRREPIEGGQILDGHLRFDGCMHIGAKGDTMLHFCDFAGPDPVLAKIMRAVADLGPAIDGWGYEGEETKLRSAFCSWLAEHLAPRMKAPATELLPNIERHAEYFCNGDYAPLFAAFKAGWGALKTCR